MRERRGIRAVTPWIRAGLQRTPPAWGFPQVRSRIRRRALAAASVLLASVGGLAVPSASAATLTFGPTADAHIRSDQPTANFGSATRVRVDARPVHHILLTFVVTGVGSDPVDGATLRLYNVDSSNKGGAFYRVADTSWSESTVTWNDAPPADPTPIASLGAVNANVWYEVDLRSLVTGDGIYSLRITSTSNNEADYVSKEGASAFAPRLVVTTTTPPPPPVSHMLEVTKLGAGTGTVTSSPAGIDCGATCSALFPEADTVTLSATPAADSVFAGWSGDCAGVAPCVLPMSSDRTVGAAFEPDPGPPPPPPPPPDEPDPRACTGYPEPRIYYETQSWWEPVPDVGGQGHVHLGVCWPHDQTVSGPVRLDLVVLFHGNRGTITEFKVQDDFSTDYEIPVNIPVDAAGTDVSMIQPMTIDTSIQPDGLRQWRIYVYFTHANGNQQIARAMHRVDVENFPGDADEVGPNYSEYGGSGWYKEVEKGSTNWGYQTAELEPSSHLAIGACVAGTWTAEVELDQRGTTEHLVTVDPDFHGGDEGMIVHRSTTDGYEGPVAIDTTLLADGWHKLVLHSAKQVGDKENGGVFVLPFRVCNGA